MNGVLFMLDAERSGEPIELDRYVPVVLDASRKHDKPAEKRPFNLERELQKSRAAAIEACVALAERFELSDCVQVTIDARFGYFMCELPKRNASKLQVGAWKFLATACDQARASKRALKQILNPELRLAESLVNRRAAEVYETLREFDLFDCGDRLIHALDDTDWAHVVELMGSYRRMRKPLEEHGLNL